MLCIVVAVVLALFLGPACAVNVRGGDGLAGSEQLTASGKGTALVKLIQDSLAMKKDKGSEARPTFVVTGFNGFSHYANPTETLVKDFNNTSFLPDLLLLTRVLDVSVDSIHSGLAELDAELLALGAEPENTFWLHLGFYPSTTVNRLEKRAFNDASFSPADNQNFQPHSSPIELNKSHGLAHERYTHFDLNWIQMHLAPDYAYTQQITDDPGLYLCNYLYYYSMAQQSHKNVLFVHIPDFDVIDEETQLGFFSTLVPLLPRAVIEQVSCPEQVASLVATEPRPNQLELNKVFVVKQNMPSCSTKLDATACASMMDDYFKLYLPIRGKAYRRGQLGLWDVTDDLPVVKTYESLMRLRYNQPQRMREPVAVAIIFAPNLTEAERARLIAETVSYFSLALATIWDAVPDSAIRQWQNDPSNFQTYEWALDNSLEAIEKRAKDTLVVPSLPAFTRKAIAIGPAPASSLLPVLGNVTALY